MLALEVVLEDLREAVANVWRVVSEVEEDVDTAQLERALILIEEWEDDQGWG